MKRGLIFLFALVILGSMASAANSYDLDDFSEKPMQGIVIGEGDEVRFKLFNATHTIVFDKVIAAGFRFSGYAYMNSKFQMTGFATKSYSSHIDINRDNVSDLIVSFYSSEFNEAANATYDTAIFRLENNIPTAYAVEPANDIGVTDKSRSKYLVPVAVVAFILILVLIARKTSKNKQEAQ